MSIPKKALIPFLVWALISLACQYIVLPEEEESSKSAKSKGWSAVVTNVGKSDAGDLHIDITIRNETFDWSAMQAAKQAQLKVGNGKATNCDTVFVSTGGHRLAPGFQMRGYIAGTKAQPKTQLIYVECQGAEAAPGSKLSIDYTYYTGQLNYYELEANKATETLELNLDQVATDLKYPVAESVEGLINQPDTPLTVINQNVLTLIDVQRTDTGLELKWQNSNPSDYNLKVHIGNPPVIGEDGILYGYFEIMDLESPPMTPAKGTADWITKVAVPKDVKGFYVLLSAESGKQRLYANFAIDITDK